MQHNTFEMKGATTTAKEKKEGVDKSGEGTPATTKTQPGSVPKAAVTVHSSTEDVLCGMFDIELRDLLDDP